MPSVTREQVNKWNAKLQNGFRFDIQRYVVWGEKQIKKSIELADGRILTAEIHFRDARDGYKYIGNEACISLAIWTRCENSDMIFQPTRPLRGATYFSASAVEQYAFQPTRPLRGATAKEYKSLCTFLR